MDISTPTKKSGGTYGVIYRLHSVAGVLVAPLLVIAALSGFLYAFAPSLENFVYRDAITASSTEPAQPLEEQIEAAQAVHPDLQLAAVESFGGPAKTTRVLFDYPALESSSYRQAVFVDPGSLEITGDLVQYGSSRALPLRTWISEGHRQLWLGEPGRIYSEVAASWLGIFALAGGWQWWAKRKKKRSLHSALGIWLLPGFLFLTVTGLTWSSMAGGNIANLRAELDWTQPSVNTDEHAHHGHESQAGELSSQESIDTVAATARVAGLSGIIEMVPPAEEGAAWTVTEMREEWKLSNDAIAVDGEAGEFVDRVDHAEWPLAAKLSAWLIQLHMGTLFGWINQLVLGVITLGLLVVILLGYRVWWKRRRFPAAGQWRRTRPGLLAGIIVFLLAYSVMAPMFGINLVAFLVLDAVIKNVATRKSKSE